MSVLKAPGIFVVDIAGAPEPVWMDVLRGVLVATSSGRRRLLARAVCRLAAHNELAAAGAVDRVETRHRIRALARSYLDVLTHEGFVAPLISSSVWLRTV